MFVTVENDDIPDFEVSSEECGSDQSDYDPGQDEGQAPSKLRILRRIKQTNNNKTQLAEQVYNLNREKEMQARKMRKEMLTLKETRAELKFCIVLKFFSIVSKRKYVCV